MKSSELNQRRQQATPRGVGVMCNYFVEKAEKRHAVGYRRQ
ncbi:Gamma-aminobutyrate:alpha-ketoglutarate aminotransferase [Klebsiella pneumoniae IS43]|uniref:Gamma-aminobutyrate:alpha-ketoglutarate aminotransferase n=1 Tax=Klebsiella pneumoniae IS43 TaxID=1432552 RepID=W1DQG4_KLEPN|nr:Gamma-aminobutyrate:alpha-ketoglutarate aminotransferase [Klebsiella pneumoniae IS43]CDL51597.1 Gamma-aminobutyrate:alpha-ketoglutarate aminotransferase [Klebsiella pneumoniae ISC21]CDL64520.1 Gamma-aminobutyrate:alpha-ketoglutarate aminotransferase [Klebsiella pneumoniae IS39]